MKILILSLLTLSLSACKSPSVGCVIQGGADALLAPAIAQGLSCSNPSAVLASLQAAGQKAGLCTQTAAPAAKDKGVVADVCAALGNALLGSLANAAIPSSWACSPTTATQSLQGIITVACNLIPAVKK